MDNDIFLLLKQKLDIKKIQDILNDKYKNNDIWTEINTMQIEIDNKQFVDFVEYSDYLDESDKSFLNDNNFNSIYCISYNTDYELIVINMIKSIFEKYEGALGNDTDDFQPLYDKNSLDKFRK